MSAMQGDSVSVFTDFQKKKKFNITRLCSSAFLFLADVTPAAYMWVSFRSLNEIVKSMRKGKSMAEILCPFSPLFNKYSLRGQHCICRSEDKF